MKFKELVEQSRSAGVTDERNLPFILGPNDRQSPALLLCHGFGSSPWEVRSFGERMAAEGYRVLAIRLPGHGTRPEDLEQQKAEDWIDAAEQGYRLLSEQHPKVGVVGQSTGALIQLQLVARQPVDALMLLSPFLRTRHRFAPLAGMIHPLYRWRKRPISKEEEHAFYDRQPVRAIHQINRLISMAAKELPLVTCPTLVMATEGDRTIDPKSSVNLFYQLGCVKKELHLFGPDVPHVLTAETNPQIDALLAFSRFFFQQQLTR